MVVKKKTMRRRSVRKNVRKSVRRNLKKSSKRNVRKSVRRMSSKRNVRKSVKRNVRKRGGGKYTTSNPNDVSVEDINKCLSRLKINENHKTGSNPGINNIIKHSPWWKRKKKQSPKRVQQVKTKDVLQLEDIFEPASEDDNRGNEIEGVERVIAKIEKLKKKIIDKGGKEDIVNIINVLPKSKARDTFINCLNPTYQGAQQSKVTVPRYGDAEGGPLSGKRSHTNRYGLVSRIDSTRANK